VIVQLAPLATLAPQLFASRKSPGFAPVYAKFKKPRAEPPLFVSVTVCGLEVVLMFCDPNVSEELDNDTDATPPDPERVILVVSFVTTSVTIRVAGLAPARGGWKLTLI
jgi:hypothetical protein